MPLLLLLSDRLQVRYASSLLTYMSSFLREERVCCTTSVCGPCDPNQLCKWCLCNNATYVNRGCATTLFLCVVYIVIMMSNIYNTLWCFNFISVHIEFQWTVILIQACGGTVGSSPTSTCYGITIFPPTHSRWIRSHPGKDLEAQCSARCEMKMQINVTQWRKVAMPQHPEQFWLEIFPCHRTAKKEVILQCSALRFQFMSFARKSAK